MKKRAFSILTLILIGTVANGLAQAPQLPIPAVQRPGGRAGRGQASIEKSLADQPTTPVRAGRGQPNTDTLPDQPSKQANDLPKLNPQQQKLANAIERRYIARVQQRVGLTDAQADKVSDGLQRFLRRSMVLAVQRAEIMDRIQTLTDKKGSPLEFQQQNQRLTLNQNQQRRAEDNFYSQISPELNPEQQGRLRLFMSQTNKEVLQTIQESRQQ